MRLLTYLPLLLSCSFLTLSPHLAAASSRSVLTNPLAMTISQTLVGPQKDDATRSQLSLIPQRKKVFLLEEHGDLKFSYRLQADKRAPLVFVIPGTGGNSESHSAQFIAEQLFKLGYQAVIVDNPFSWKFTISGSHSALPGYAPRDAEDLYRAMQRIHAVLAHQQAIRPRSYSLVGSSLGGLQALFIQKIDTQFNFKKVLAINPPLDMMHAAKRLDHFYEVGESLSENRKLQIFNTLYEFASNLSERKKAALRDPNFLQNTFEEFRFNDQDMSYLIGKSFRTSLRDVIFASQQVYDLKILKNKVTRLKRNARYEEAYRFSFYQYLNQFVYPQIRKNKGEDYNLEALNREVSIYQFEADIKNNDHIFVIHSLDDFLLKKGDAAWLKNTFGDRALLFDYGGHCGSMNFTEFADQLRIVFRK